MSEVIRILARTAFMPTSPANLNYDSEVGAIILPLRYNARETGYDFVYYLLQISDRVLYGRVSRRAIRAREFLVLEEKERMH